jgi:hypothetical protein
MINMIVSIARVTTLSSKYLIDLPVSSALLGQVEDVMFGAVH